jgi:uncharacterized membrane protein (Fun14 family)
MSQHTLRPLSIGEILDGAFTLYRRHFLVLVGTQVAVLAPAALAGLASTPGANLFYVVVLAPIALGGAVWQMSEAALGRDPSLASGFRVGLRRYFPMLGITIAYGFLAVLGVLALIVGVFFVMVYLFAVHAVTIIERNAQTAIQRSYTLAKGAKGRIFVVTTVAGIIAFLPAFALGLATGLTSTVGTGAEGEPIFVEQEETPLVFSLRLLVQALTAPFSAGAMTLLYYDQRVRKEGLDIEMSASALDGTATEASAGP